MYTTTAYVNGRVQQVVMDNAPAIEQPQGYINGRKVHYHREYVHADGSPICKMCTASCFSCPIGHVSKRAYRIAIGCRQVFSHMPDVRAVWVAEFDDPVDPESEEFRDECEAAQLEVVAK